MDESVYKVENNTSKRLRTSLLGQQLALGLSVAHQSQNFANYAAK